MPPKTTEAPPVNTTDALIKGSVVVPPKTAEIETIVDFAIPNKEERDLRWELRSRIISLREEALTTLRKETEEAVVEARREEKERIKARLRGKEIVATEIGGDKSSMFYVGTVLAALEDWPDLPETSY